MQKSAFPQISELCTFGRRPKEGGMVRCQASGMKSIKEYRLKYLCTSCGLIFHSKEMEPHCPGCQKGTVIFWGKVDHED